VQYCPGEVCEIKDRHEIQKTNWLHLIVILIFILFMVAVYFFFGDFFSLKPFDLFGLEK
jgi:hypothetical protein